jgi:hypothetical protein
MAPPSGLGLPPAPLQRLRRELRRNVLVEEGDVVLVPVLRLLPVPRVRLVVGRRLSVTDRLDHGVRVLGEPGSVVVAGEIRRHGVVASLAERGLNEVPIQPTSPAPWIRTNVLIPRPPCVFPSLLRTPFPCMERRRGRRGLIGSTTRAADVLVLVPDIPFSDDAP